MPFRSVLGIFFLGAVAPACGTGDSGAPDAGRGALDAGRSDAAPAVDAAEEEEMDLALCEGATSPPAAGRLVVHPLRDFIPLCAGRVLVADAVDEAVLAIDVVSGEELLRVPLQAVPSDLELDRERGILFAALLGEERLARIDLGTGDATFLDLPGWPLSLALADGGHLFVSIPGEATYDVDVVYLDADSGEVVTTFATSWDPPQIWFERLLVFDRDGNQLISAKQSGSPARIRRHAFDPQELTMADAQERSDVGGNGQMLVISPDGDHVAYCVGSGNGNYDIFDFSADDLFTVQGEWETGAYPRAAAFSSDSERLLSTNGGLLKLFSVETYELIDEWPAALEDCSYHSVERVGVSPEGDLLFGYSDCGFDDDSGQIVWQPAP